MKRAVLTHIRSNRKKYMFLCMSYILGMLLGYICLGLFSEDVIAELTQYIGGNFKTFLSYSETLDKSAYFRDVFGSEAISFCVMWIMGLSALGVFYGPAFMLYKGYVFGFTCAFMLKCFDGKGLVFDVLVLFSQNVIKLPVLMFAAMCTMSHALKKTSSPSQKHYRREGGLMGVYTMFMAGALLFYCIGIYVECYIIPHFVFLLAKDMI
ncbi:MAG: hypothetical protein E7218_08010 [Anaerofustis stercorihominis]|nr:hypothetical protein [Anaerofustis stercorihominis]